MREAEFIQLLDKVDTAMNPAIFESAAVYYDEFTAPVAANDNTVPWDHAPFPNGWIASC